MSIKDFRKIAFIIIVFVLISIIDIKICYSSESDLTGYNKAAENDALVLYVSNDLNEIAVMDKRDRNIWYSKPREYENIKLNTFWNNKINSIAEFKFSDIESKNGNILDGVTGDEKISTEAEYIKNGIIFTFNYEKYGLVFSIEILLEDDALVIRILDDRIIEKSNYGFVEIVALPYLMTAGYEEKGYYFYPDGCGAVFNFKKENIYLTNNLTYTFYPYGNPETNIDRMYEEESRNIQDVMLPVCGMNKNGNGILGVISEGEAYSKINIVPNVKLLSSSQMTVNFIIRRRLAVPTVYLDENTPTFYSNDIIETNRELRLYFLTKNKASYSDMAQKYRGFLLENGEIFDRIDDEDELPFILDIFMGVTEERLLFDKYIKMTDFKDTKEMVEGYIKSGVDNLYVNLLGWQKGGYGKYPVFWPVERRIGGFSGLKAFSEYLAGSGAALLMQNNYINIIKDNKGFSAKKDTVYKENGLLLNDNGIYEYIANTAFVKRNSKYFLKKLLGLINGITFERIGSLIYDDFNEKKRVNRVENIGIWQEMLEESNSKLGESSSDGGNAYVLKEATLLRNIPVCDSGYKFTDYEIPFYQMVVHGLIPYTSEPGNMFYDLQKQKLQWIEYGCVPNYLLTYERSSKMRYTYYSMFFSTCYNDWLDISLKVYNELKNEIGDLWKERIIRHEYIGNDLVAVTYESGGEIIINYSENKKIYKNHIIEAENYIVLRKDEVDL